MLRPAARLKILSRVKSTVTRHHFNIGGVDYTSWFSAIDEQTPTLLSADDQVFENGVQTLLTQLRSSHTNFYRSNTNPVLPQHVIGATLRSVPRAGNSQWMFQDVFEDSPAACAGVNPGHFLKTVNGTHVFPPNLPMFSFGMKHQVTVELPGGSETKTLMVSIPPRRTRGRRPPLIEPKDVGYQMLRNVGILRIAFFSGAFGIRFSRRLATAVESLKRQGCNRLIVDLRGCLGGSLGFASLVSYLCPDQIPIGYDVTRRRLQQGYNVAEFPRVPMPRTIAGLLFCLARFSIKDKSLMLLTQGLGKQPFHGRVVVLVNEWTNSAGEIAAQFARHTRLATVVGTRTAGRVLGSTAFNVGNGYTLYLPFFGWYGVGGSSTENSGVEPDVAVDIDPDKIGQGEDAQLKKALELLESR
jgi:carboxyl-terminal processing protease